MTVKQIVATAVILGALVFADAVLKSQGARPGPSGSIRTGRYQLVSYEPLTKVVRYTDRCFVHADPQPGKGTIGARRGLGKRQG